MKVLVPLAQGFEEIEGVTIIDVLRRAQINVVTAGLDGRSVTGSHAIEVMADTNMDKIKSSEFGCMVLPGGMPGSKNLKNNPAVISALKDISSAGGLIAAVCAAPIALHKAGLLAGKKFTCYPGYESEIENAEYNPEPVIVDGRIVTGRGPGCALPFSLKIVELLAGADIADKLKNGMQVYWM